MKKNVYKEVIKNKLLSLTIIMFALVIAFPFFREESRSEDYTDGYPTLAELEEEDRVATEMLEAGYSFEQMMDQISEQVYNKEGGYGTGGRDGLLLNGTPAPNAPSNTGGGGTTGNTTTPVATPTPKPTCNHDYTSEVTTEATCGNEGKITYTCSLCGKSYSENIPKEEHNFTVKEEVKGTCVSAGYRIEVCSGCSEELTIEGLYGNHALIDHTDEIKPTCLEGGYSTQLCSICGVIIKTDLPALDHEWETEPTIDELPGCESEGTQSYHCTRCEETTNSEVAPALGHAKVVEDVPATMFGDGYHKEYCDRCGRTFVDEVEPSTVVTYRVPLITGGIVFVVLVGIISIIIIKKRKKKIA